MTTPKELADKARRQAGALEVTCCIAGMYRKAPAFYEMDRNALLATIDQLQAMAEARQGSGEPVAQGLMDEAARRYVATKGAYWWHVRIGDGKQLIGKCHTKGSAEELAAHLVRAYRDGHFSALNTAPPSAQQALAALVRAHDDMHAARRAAERDEPEPHAEVAYTAARIMVETRIKEARAALNAAPPSAQQATGSGQVLTDEHLDKAITFAEHLAAATQAQPEDTEESIAEDVYDQLADMIGPHVTDTADGLPGSVVGAFAVLLDHWKLTRHTNAAPTTGKREPLTQQDIDDILSASLAAEDEDVCGLVRRVERYITGEQR